MAAVSSRVITDAVSNVYPLFPAKPLGRGTRWENFDARCDELARGVIDFATFGRLCERDFQCLVRSATRKRRAPASLEEQDLAQLAAVHAWHYLFRHEGKSGVVGFDASRGKTAGEYVRFNVGKRLQKDLSSARGENQHRRDVTTAAPVVPTPEGFDPPDSSHEIGFEGEMDRRRDLRLLKDRFAEDLREHAVLAAVIKSAGDDQGAATLLLETAASRFVTGVTDQRSALRAIGSVLDVVEKRRAKVRAKEMN